MLSPKEVTRHEKNKCAAGDRNIGTSAVCSAGAASTVLARRIRLQVGCGRHQVAAASFSRRSGSQHSIAYVVESAPDCQTCCINTVVFAGGVTIISLFFDSMAAYAFARMKFTRKKAALWNHPAHDDDSVSGGDDSTLYGRISSLEILNTYLRTDSATRSECLRYFHADLLLLGHTEIAG